MNKAVQRGCFKEKKARESMVVEEVPPTMTSTVHVFHFSVAISVEMTVQYFLLFYDFSNFFNKLMYIVATI